MRHSTEGHIVWRWLYLVLAALILLLGAATAGLGGWLLMLGGTVYYLATGLLLLVGGVLAFLGRHKLALGAMALALVVTLAWALIEIAGKGWMPTWGFDLAARVGLVAGLVVAAGMSYLFWRTSVRSGASLASLGGVAVVLVAVAAVVAIHWERSEAPASVAAAPAAPVAVGPREASADWTHFGGTTHGRRYSTLSGINAGNIDELDVAWTFRSGDLTPAPGRIFYSSQNTPIKVGGSLYTCTSSAQVYALDPATGYVRWRYDPDVPEPALEQLFSVACRAVGYFDSGADVTMDVIPEVPGIMPAVPRGGSACARRIFVATADGRLIALDAIGGHLCRGFGAEGVVDLTLGMGLREPGFASNTSGATVAGGLVIVGQQVSDNQRRDAPSGVVRAYDAETGELRWAWDALRPDPQAPLDENDIYPRGTPNVWNVISADEELGLAFLGTGNGGGDHWGGNRTEEEDRFTAAVVAVDLVTGETRWVFTTVVHDLWDYDLGAQPMVLDLEIDGTVRRAVLQGTKAGDLFVLDAATGEPLRPVEYRPVPQGGELPGERLEPTQPQSVFYPNLGGVPGQEPERIDERHLWGLTPIDAALCRIEFLQRRYEGMFTPPTLEQKGMVLLPGTVGGMNWGGLGFDPAQRLIISNHSRLPNIVDMHPRADVEDRAAGSGGTRPDQEIAPQSSTPFGVTRPMWLSILDVPCLAPPWGYLNATNVDTGELVWSKPFGTGYDTGPLGIPTRIKIAMGTPNLGGPLVTAGGLTFIGAAQDNYLRAFETATGRLVWEARLPAGSQAGPMTYEHEGRQYVAMTATGHARFETTEGDYLVVYALPPTDEDLSGVPNGAAADPDGTEPDEEMP
ncbi:pyrroloquinoline quinone-dependent dehydrogenase [Aquibium carbonis]|uniref:Pyrroloquinoline quinone-dependent dehydrogenase n=1 Tax=Aquibium carbonis TaxID=2495581 RepID=A0A3S0G6P5_9HYPH|nr:pyrroloquinoline quinone-dependent dehydrogenase [Aquibium carbonis]RST84993.1 pyrroloquinoline quinone-dependent dehydrogenase [Aquibium carbonis]